MSLSKFYFRKYYSHSHMFWKVLPRDFEQSWSKRLITGWTFLQKSLLYCRKCPRWFMFVLLYYFTPCHGLTNAVLQSVMLEWQCWN